ncbi:MAG: hypothetical protein CVV47_01960 [Spirochaetae bacterium HGW-Spirochaetae-3]|jgi:hypothetical protein|nr:MAG: hypothetical protein CVV47_01960 [Spirochaetae bacterium HGW-Spirochaetae-3]
MRRTEVAAELAGIVGMLRDHAFLRYSESGRAEYQLKLRTASGLFAAVVAKATGVPVTNPFPDASVEGAVAGGPDSGTRVAKRIAASLAAAAARGSGRRSASLAAAAEAWREAAEAISALPR